MEIALILTVGTLNIACFFIGAKVGQLVTNDKPLEGPFSLPLKKARQQREKKEAELKQDRLNTIIRNIENYDGTGRGQEDVPRG